MLFASPVGTFSTDESSVLSGSSEPEGVSASTFTNALIAAIRCSVASLSASAVVPSEHTIVTDVSSLSDG